MPEGKEIADIIDLSKPILYVEFSSDLDNCTGEFGLLVEVGGVASNADKTALKELMGEAPAKDDTSYYHTDDYYNGKTTSTNGFWSDFQNALENAKKVADDDFVSQAVVDAADAKLSAAIGKLIPTTQVNTSALYQELQDAQDLVWGGETGVTAIPRPVHWSGGEDSNVTESSTSAVTWGPFQTALKDGQALLGSLYDENGAPTDVNTSENKDLPAEIEDQVKAIQDAVDALDPRADTVDVQRSKMALEGINLYANTLYNQKNLTESDYTPESWNAFVTARNHALEMLRTSKSFPGMGQKVVRTQQKEFGDLQTACYGLVNSSGPITVHFSAVDNYAVRKEKASMKVNTCDLKLSAGATVSDALEKAGVSLSSDEWDSRIGYYLNGVSYVDLNLPYQGESSTGIGLRDGDTLVVAREAPPTYTNLSGDAGVDTSVLPHYETVRVSTDVVAAGDAFTVSAATDGSAPTNRTGTASPLSGAAVYASAPCSNEEEARTAPVTNVAGAVTGEDGKAAVKLYCEGWYALNVFDLSGDGGMYNGQTVLIHVTAAKDPSAVRTDLKKELTKLAGKYSEDFFASADWKSIQQTEKDALSAIDSAASIGEAYSAEQEAVKAIIKIQEDTAKANQENLSWFLKILNELPDDSAKIDKSVEGDIQNLISRYGSMTKYQIRQLTQKELQKYQKIQKIYDAGLPEAKEYGLSVKTVVEGDAADQAALADMVQWLEQNTASDDEDVNGNGENQRLADLNSLNQVKVDVGNHRGYAQPEPVTSASAQSVLWACINPDYAAYFHVRESDTHSVSSPSGDQYKWSISDENITFDNNNAISILKGKMTYTVNGVPYEVKSVTVGGVDKYDSPTDFYVLDNSSYKNKEKTACRLVIPNSFLKFTMPFNAVTVTVTWGPVSGTENEIAAAKNTAKRAIQAAYGNYRESDYTSEDWTALRKAEQDGLSKVEAAASVDAVGEARQAALAAMASVKRNSESSSTGENSDYGKTIGQVHITVENNTFPGGAFTGTILSGWYDLCKKDTMMTCVLKALKAKGYSWTGTGGTTSTGDDITYLASIYQDTNGDGKCDNGESKLGEFDGDPGSGWMGTLNDWFVNEGLQNFSAADKTLENGDLIDIVYTQNLGEDVGGTWGNADTSLKTLKINGGTLSPEFQGGTLTYSLLIPNETANITVTPTAANKNYLVKTFLNTYNSDAAFFKRTEAIPVTSGDTLYIGVGDSSWPSMNNQSEDAIDYTGTQYTIHVYSSDKDGIQAQINALPDAGRITLTNYQTYQSTVQQLRKTYNALQDKTGISITKLTAAENKIQFFSEIDHVKALLKKIPQNADAKDRAEIQSAYLAFTNLTDEQKLYITVGDVEKYNAAVKKLGVGKTISGSDTVPNSSIIEPASRVSGSAASASVSQKQIADAISAMKKNGESVLTIVPQDTKSAASIDVTIPKTAVQAVADVSGTALAVETPGGNVTIPNDTLLSVAQRAAGNDLKITVAKKTAADISDSTVDLTNAVIAEVTMTSNNQAITTFDGKSIAIDLAVGSAYREGQGYRVIVRSSDGKVETKTGQCVRKNGGLYVEVQTTHLSTFIVTNQRAMPFTDVKEGAWYYDSVKYAYGNGLFAGTTSTTFSPNASMTRAMLVAVLYRMEGSPAVSGTNPFTDVADQKYYASAVIWAAQQKIICGTSATTFAPDTPVSRQQMAAILYRYAQIKEYDTTHKSIKIQEFDDYANISSYALTALNWAVHAKLIQGFHHALNPTEQATRAQVAVVLTRFAGNVVK